MAEMQSPVQIHHDKDSAYVRNEDDQSLPSSYETQHSTENIEAISQAWTKWSLIDVDLFPLRTSFLPFLQVDART